MNRAFVTRIVSAASLATTLGATSASVSGGQAIKPKIALVAPESSPILDAMPKALRESCNFVHIKDGSGETKELHDAVGLLWVPSAGKPSSSPASTLAALWPSLPRCCWVHCFTTGVDGLKPFISECLLPSADRVVLTNGRGAFSAALAEHALAGMLFFNKQLSRCEHNRKEKKWDNFVMGTMSGKTVGLVGYGSIGQCTGRAAKAAFGCRIIALRRRDACGRVDGELADEIFSFEDRKFFLKQCDFVVSSLPSTPETQNFFGPEEFAAMKEGSVFVSLGRGAVVDEDALAEALTPQKPGGSGHLKGAVLDVFKVEPLPSASPLWQCPNVLLTAHNADYTSDYFELGWKVFGENLDTFTAAGGDNSNLATPVDMNQGY